MSKRVFLWLQTVVALAAWLAWAYASVGASPSAGRIQGQLVAGPVPAPGQPVTLRLYGAQNDVAVLTATTTITGYYEFANPPTPPDGWTYYVQFGPNEMDPAYVGYWFGPDILAYQAGEERDAGVFDIADVKLGAPTADAGLRPPVVFQWTPRGNATDVYQVHLVNLASQQDTALDPVGNQGTATLTEADAARRGLKYGERYYWYVSIHNSGVEGSVGVSLGAWDITFMGYQLYLPLVSANPPPR